MPRTPLPLGFSFYQSESSPFAGQRCVNWIPVVAESAALSTRALFQPPGLKIFKESTVIGNRGGIPANGVPYFVNGNSLISLSVSGVETIHGTIEGSGRVSLAVNAKNADTGSQFIVIVVPGGKSYAFATVTNILTEITDTDFLTSDTVFFSDGFFIFSASDGSVFFVSRLNDPLTYDALDRGTAEISPDNIAAIHVNHNEVFVCGDNTIELFDRILGAGFPYQRIEGANIQKGVHAKFSLVEFDNTFCFAGGGLNEKTAIWKVTGSSSATKISTDAIDSEIQKFTRDEISDAFALTYARHGQFLAIFTFESERIPSRTFFYNATASALLGQHVWGEFQTGLDREGNRFRVESIVSAYGKLLVGDQTTGIIGEIDDNTLTHYGDPILRKMITAPFSQDGIAIMAGEFEATFQAGVGLTNNIAPVVQMRVSDDGGHTFNSITERSIGKIGEYGQRSIWRRQGRFPVARRIELSITDPVKANLIRLAATPELGVQ